MELNDYLDDVAADLNSAYRQTVVERAADLAEDGCRANFSKLRPEDEGCLILTLVESEFRPYYTRGVVPKENVFGTVLKMLDDIKQHPCFNEYLTCRLEVKHIATTDRSEQYVFECYLKIFQLVFIDLDLKWLTINIQQTPMSAYTSKMFETLIYMHPHIRFNLISADNTTTTNNITTRLSKFSHFNKSVYDRLVKETRSIVLNEPPKPDTYWDKFSFTDDYDRQQQVFDQLVLCYNGTFQQRIEILIWCLKQLALPRDVISLIVCCYCLDCCSYADIGEPRKIEAILRGDYIDL